MQRYFALDEKLTLDKSDYHHIKNVMRMKKDDIIEVVYENIIYKCKVDPKNEILNVVEKKEEEENKIKIMVAFSLLKEQKIDYLMQKATETGAYSFIPLITNRTIIKYNEKKDDSKKARWKKIVKEASEQSFRVNMPIINDVCLLKNLDNYEADLKILFTLNEKTENIKKVLAKNNKCDKILIVVGPEGGFSKEEEDLLVNQGFISTSLGKNVLRAETAPVVAISMINYEFMR